jgi:hypothetical protein
MFQTLVTLATLIATGAHALLGCCWHHDHACHHECCPIESADEHEVVSDPPCGCRHTCHNEECDHSKASSESSVATAIDGFPCGHSGEHGSRGCDEGRCQSLKGSKVELPSLERPNVFGGLVPSLDIAGSSRSLVSGLETQTLSASLLSGRLCVRDLTQIARI